MSRTRPDPSTGEGWRTVHVRPATYAWLSRLKGRGGSYDALIRLALTRMALWSREGPGAYRPHSTSTFWGGYNPPKGAWRARQQALKAAQAQGDVA